MMRWWHCYKVQSVQLLIVIIPLSSRTGQVYQNNPDNGPRTGDESSVLPPADLHFLLPGLKLSIKISLESPGFLKLFNLGLLFLFQPGVSHLELIQFLLLFAKFSGVFAVNVVKLVFEFGVFPG